MKRQVLRVVGVAAIAGGGLLAAAVGAHADSSSNSGSSNGNQYRYIYQNDTVVCGNAIAVDAVVHTRCDGDAVTIDRDDVDWQRFITDLDLDFVGDSPDDEDGQWFHIGSRTWS